MSDFPSQRMRDAGDFLKTQGYALVAEPRNQKYYLIKLRTEKQINEFVNCLKEKQND